MYKYIDLQTIPNPVFCYLRKKNTQLMLDRKNILIQSNIDGNHV